MTNFKRRDIRSNERGLTEVQAREVFKTAKIAPTAQIGELVEKDGYWHCSIFEPLTTTAAYKESSPPFPPSDESEDAPEPSPESDSPDESEAPDSPPSNEGSDGPSESKPKSEHKEKSGEGEEIALLHQILEALVALGPGAPPMGPGAGGPGGPPPGPPGAGAGPHIQEVIHRRGLKPGETPPGGTPIGAPALSSVQYPLSSFNSLVGVTDGTNVTLKQAADNLKMQFEPHGLKVKQIKRDGNKIAALLARR